ncbi:DUF2975 domain-containing protein [Pseudoalteromonas sp. MMG010]|uniref:DUF2975 domain-containing protein n=1 Tax=Pseudoalteromonas sp. MMG010 TaxID=2822685 RepID=UPI001B3A0B25|nr:DUF2975 domain-containing protein [Pseudoalteromonas sp. MMG010]MBQ4832077.1 DUF2975 domain-containing protein [Pseudoalteromonas sp. MMG010]
MKKITYMSNLILALLILGLAITLISATMVILSNTPLLSYNSASGTNMWIGLEVSGSWQHAAQRLSSNNYNPILWLGIMQILPLICINCILIRLFRLYQQGVFFSVKNSQCFSWLGAILVFQFVMVAIAPALVFTIITAIDGIELKRVVSISDTDIISLIAGLIIFVIGWIMKQAHQLQQEQALVI